MKTLNTHLVDSYEYTRHIPIVGFVKKNYLIAGSDSATQKYFEERFGTKATTLTKRSAIITSFISFIELYGSGLGVDKGMEMVSIDTKMGEIIGLILTGAAVAYNAYRFKRAVVEKEPSPSVSIFNIILNYATGAQKNNGNIINCVQFAYDSQGFGGKGPLSLDDYVLYKEIDKKNGNLGFL